MMESEKAVRIRNKAFSHFFCFPPTQAENLLCAGTVLGGRGRAVNKATRSALKELRSGEKETNTEDAPTALNGSFGRRPHTRAGRASHPAPSLPGAKLRHEPRAHGLPVTPLI